MNADLEQPQQPPEDKNAELARQAGEKAGAAVEKGIAFILKLVENAKPFLKKTGTVIAQSGKKAIEWLGKAASAAAAFIGKTVDKVKATDWNQKVDGVKQAAQKAGSSPFGSQVKKIPGILKNFTLKIVAAFFGTAGKLQQFLNKKFPQKFNEKTSRGISFGILGAGLLICLCLVASLFSGIFSKSGRDGETSTSISGVTGDIEGGEPQAVVDPARQTWLVMVYADADDEILEEDIFFDMNELEAVGSSDRVQIVAQLDRYREGFGGDGNWTGTRRYLVRQDDDLSAISSEMVEDLGESNMGSIESLIDFVTWAVKEYPADRHVLIMSDHGAGWPGGWTDPDPESQTALNWIYLNQIGSALDQIIRNTSIGKFELIGLDACLMGMLEVYNELAPYSNYAVASQETEPALGWAYADFLGQLVARPEMDGAELARSIVEGYITQDLRIQDPQARMEMLNGYGITDDMSPEQLAQEMGTDITLSAVNLTLLPELNAALDDFLIAIKDVDQGIVAEARTYAQSFKNVFDESFPSPYIDLLHFARLLQEKSTDVDLSTKVQQLETAIDTVLVAEKHGERRSGASGFSIHFPVSEFYWGENINYVYYTNTALRFTGQSLWDDFLTYHYTGQDFGQGAPSREARIPAPGYSKVTITKPVVTPDVISIANPTINVKSDITGDRVAYVYLVNLFKYEDRFLFYQFDYVLGDSNLELNGVEYPAWERENGVISISITTEITATAVSDGKTVAFAVLQPEAYSDTSGNNIFSAKGFYIHADTGRKDSARMYFYNSPNNNRMRNIIGYYGSEENGITHAEIIPKQGDQFQFLDTWWEFNADGQLVDTLRDGNTLTFGDQPFQQGWTPEFLIPGEYLIGIMVEDMDGFQNYSFTPYMLQ